MKKNGQYVGVDEKYVPEEEKYVETNLNDEIKKDMNNIYQGAKEYVTDKDNQEKMKKVGKTGLKITAGVVIVRVIFSVLVSLIAIAIFIFVFRIVFGISSEVFGINNIAKGIINKTASEIDKQAKDEDGEAQVKDMIDKNIDAIKKGYNEQQVDDFNWDIEDNGTKDGYEVSELLDEVVKKIKTNSDHSITVIYGTTTTSNPDEIVALKKQFDESKQYEVQMDYDSKGYINKITITDY